MYILSIHLLFHFAIYQSPYVRKDKNVKKRKGIVNTQAVGWTTETVSAVGTLGRAFIQLLLST